MTIDSRNPRHRQPQATIPTPLLSPNGQQWSDWVLAQDQANTLISFQLGQRLLNTPPPSSSGIDTPDANGLVELTGVPAWKGWRHQIAEVTNGLTGDAQGKALANLTHANGVYGAGGMQLITTCYECVFDQGFWKIPPTNIVQIPQTQSWPSAQGANGNDLGTIAGVIAACSAMNPPSFVPNQFGDKTISP